MNIMLTDFKRSVNIIFIFLIKSRQYIVESFLIFFHRKQVYPFIPFPYKLGAQAFIIGDLSQSMSYTIKIIWIYIDSRVSAYFRKGSNIGCQYGCSQLERFNRWESEPLIQTWKNKRA